MFMFLYHCDPLEEHHKNIIVSRRTMSLYHKVNKDVFQNRIQKARLVSRGQGHLIIHQGLI